MKTIYHPGFIVVENGRGPIFVAPHTTQTFQRAKRGDIGTETVALLAVRELGGTAIIATLPREDIGLDFNRLPPKSCAASKNMYEHWKKNDETFSNYYKLYSWVCKNNEDYETKLKLYKNFWNAVERYGLSRKKPLYIFLHALSARLKNLPTAIDIITKSGEWMNKDSAMKLVENLNRKYRDDLQRYNVHKEDMEGEMLFWLELNDHYIDDIFGGIRKSKGISREWLEEDLTKVNEILGTKYKFSQLSSKLYKKLIGRVIKKVRMKITYENIYNGSTAHPVSPLLRKTNGIAVEIEAMSHLNEMHPDFVVKIIKEIVNIAYTTKR